MLSNMYGELNRKKNNVLLLFFQVTNSTTSDGGRLPCPNNGDKQQNTKLMNELKMEQAENAACFVSIV